MTRLLTLTTLLLLAFIPSQPVRAQHMQVMSWNIRYDNLGDGLNSWRLRKDWVAEIIQREKIDIAGFQEVLAGQFEDLQKQLPEFASYGVGRDDGKQRGEMVPIFYRTSRYKLLDKGVFWLSSTPDQPGSKGWDAAITRIAGWVKLQERDTGHALFVLNAHFDHRGSEARQRSAELIVERVRTQFAGHPVIFLGDLNAIPNSAAYKSLTADSNQPRLFDAHARSKTKPTGPDSTWNGFRKIEPGERIDYIFTTGTLTVEQHRTLEDQRDGRFPSDHLPVVVELSSERRLR